VSGAPPRRARRSSARASRLEQRPADRSSGGGVGTARLRLSARPAEQVQRLGVVALGEARDRLVEAPLLDERSRLRQRVADGGPGRVAPAADTAASTSAATAAARPGSRLRRRPPAPAELLDRELARRRPSSSDGQQGCQPGTAPRRRAGRARRRAPPALASRRSGTVEVRRDGGPAPGCSPSPPAALPEIRGRARSRQEGASQVTTRSCRRAGRCRPSRAGILLERGQGDGRTPQPLDGEPALLGSFDDSSSRRGRPGGSRPAERGEHAHPELAALVLLEHLAEGGPGSRTRRTRSPEAPGCALGTCRPAGG